ncbi:hypothetical protein [Thalassotalea sp. ND16A]|uniref:hypothetical protein n=1 Tax=Thalassotalea sp. ND16A TaxID=1535422 RepID=UPI00051A6555|nr:hypothetical protein [Thalassotalea sp. ND16A]KGJ98133.1 hypothetical protein ND16A_0938 [Thalassotalea sp. ND16A]
MVSVLIEMPMLDVDAYASKTMQKLDAVRHQIRNGTLPTLQPKGKSGRIFINMVELANMCAQAEGNKEEWEKANWDN